jgi:hypothetical protein
MKNGALVIVMILGVFGSAFYHPAFAQSSVGGPARQKAVGGPVKQISPVVPANKGGSITVSPAPQVSGPVKQNSPVLPPNKTGSVSASPPSPLKCPAGTCAAKGTNRR